MPTMAPVVVSPVLECVLNGLQAAGGSNEKRTGNVFYYRQSIVLVPGVKASFLTAFVAAVITPLLAAANIRYTPVSATLRYFNDPTDPAATLAIAGLGAIATDSEPSEDCVVVNLLTAFRGRTFRGFKHFGGTSEVDTTRDVLVAAGLARWQAVAVGCSAVLLDAQNNQWTPFLRCRFGEQIKVNPTTVRGVDILATKTNTVVATMRKRKSKSISI